MNYLLSKPSFKMSPGSSKSSTSPKPSNTLLQLRDEYSSLNARARLSMLQDIVVYFSSGSFFMDAPFPSLLDSNVLYTILDMLSSRPELF